MVLAENNFAPNLPSVCRLAKKLVRYCLVLWLIGTAVIVSNNTAFAVDWTPCEAPCNDIYTNVYTPSPASGSSHPTGNTVQFTINVARDGTYTGQSYLPFDTVVSLSGAGTGWSTSTIAPVGSYCIWAVDFLGSEAGCTTYGHPQSTAVDIKIDVTIGTGTKRVTVKLNNLINGTLTSPVFYFDVSSSGGVRVTNLTDMPNTWNGSGDEENNDDICVYSSETNYDVLVSGPVDGGSYVLESGGNKIPITVYWNDTTGVSGRTTLDSADDPSLASVTGGDNSSETCSGGNSANLSWKASEADMQTKPAGTYSATMTVTVSTP